MPRVETLSNRNLFIQALIDKKNVMGAVILRDVRTRFFNHGLGFLIVPLWPLVHMIIVITIHTVALHGAAPAYGESAPIFVMTGVLPFLAFTYISRFMSISVVMNKSMVTFPVVKVIDILFGRAILEIIAAFCTMFFVVTVMRAIGENPFPYDLENATCAYLSMIYLAFCVGFLIGIVQLALPMMITIYQLIIIILYVSSGVYFVPSNLPDYISYPLSFNPVCIGIEWFRLSYFESYSDKLVHPAYMISVATVILLIGLMIERTFRRSLSEG